MSVPKSAVAAAIRGGATTTEQVAAVVGVPHDDRLFQIIAEMAASGWFVKVPTGPGTYRLELVQER